MSQLENLSRRNNEQRKRILNLMQVLKQLEWISNSSKEGTKFCPWCNYSTSSGHAYYCELDLVLNTQSKDKD